MWWDKIVGINVTIHSHMRAARCKVILDSTWTRPKILECIFCVNSTLDGMPLPTNTVSNNPFGKPYVAYTIVVIYEVKITSRNSKFPIVMSLNICF